MNTRIFEAASLASLASLCAALATAGCAAPTDEGAPAPAGADESETKRKNCRLEVGDPNITYFAPNGALLNTVPESNPVNGRVLALLEDKGFKLGDRGAPGYLMDTEVRCGQTWSFFGPVTSCQTQVTFTNAKTRATAHVSRTVARPGLAIDFESITWPTCKDLR